MKLLLIVISVCFGEFFSHRVNSRFNKLKTRNSTTPAPASASGSEKTNSPSSSSSKLQSTNGTKDTHEFEFISSKKNLLGDLNGYKVTYIDDYKVANSTHQLKIYKIEPNIEFVDETIPIIFIKRFFSNLALNFNVLEEERGSITMKKIKNFLICSSLKEASVNKEFINTLRALFLEMNESDDYFLCFSKIVELFEQVGEQMKTSCTGMRHLIKYIKDSLIKKEKFTEAKIQTFPVKTVVKKLVYFIDQTEYDQVGSYLGKIFSFFAGRDPQLPKPGKEGKQVVSGQKGVPGQQLAGNQVQPIVTQQAGKVFPNQSLTSIPFATQNTSPATTLGQSSLDFLPQESSTQSLTPPSLPPSSNIIATSIPRNRHRLLRRFRFRLI